MTVLGPMFRCPVLRRAKDLSLAFVGSVLRGDCVFRVASTAYGSQTHAHFITVTSSHPAQQDHLSLHAKQNHVDQALDETTID